MKVLNRENTGLGNIPPVKIIQFGEGNFLRAFVDYAFQELNDQLDYNAGVAVVQPIDKGMINTLNNQDGLYTLFMKGVHQGKEIQKKKLISNIVQGIDPYSDYDVYLNLAKEDSLEFIISNTTEAGIAYVAGDQPTMQPPNSFPAKLTLLLYKRYQYFNGDQSKGLTIIPCELINYNGDTLKEIILKYIEDWNLEDGFKFWILKHNSFHNTLVDRIVPGYPKDQIDDYNKQLDYKDNLIVTSEAFFLWVLEGDEALKKKIPFHKTNLNVKIVKSIQPYRTRKVRILNGAHTSQVPLSILFGNETVKETIDNSFTGDFVRKAVFDEIISTLDMDKSELESFAEEVFDRFRNPFIKHRLASIALNSISKFKVRVLPSLLEYESIHNRIPRHLTFALASLIRFYKGNWQGQDLPLNDNSDIIKTFAEIWKLDDYTQIAEKTLKNSDFWGEDLTKITDLLPAIALGLEEIENHGIEKAFNNFSKVY